MEKEKEKEINNFLKLMVKSSLFVFLSVILSRVLTYSYRIVIARHFGLEIYGLFSLGFIIFLWLITIFSMGLYDGLLRFISLYRGKNELHKIRYIWRLVLTILFFSSIISGIILYSSAEYISLNFFDNSEFIIFLKLFAIAIPFYMVSNIFLFVMQAFEKIKAHSFISDFLRNAINLITLILLIWIGINTNAVVFSYLLGIIAMFLAGLFYTKYKLPEIFKQPLLNKSTKKSIKLELLSYSWPLIFSGVLYGIFTYIDSFIIGYFRGVSEVGLYNSAVPIAMLLGFFPSLFTRLFFPLITKEFSRKNFKVIKELSKQIEKWILVINLPFCILMVLFPGTFINLLFGAKYILAENSLRFLAIGFFFYFMSIILSNLISMVGKSKVILMNIGMLSILNLTLNLFLVPKYGIVGAAISTMISYIILSLIFLIQVRYYTSILPLRRKMFGVFFSIIPPTILLLFFKQYIPVNFLTIILQGIFFILFYIFLIFLTKSLDKNDIMILKAIKNKLR